MQEVLRWSGAFGCDVVALQECEERTGYVELLESGFELAGVAEATANRGYVHVYVRRRDDVMLERVELGACEPCVAVRLRYGAGQENARSLVVVSVHLPAGECAEKRKEILVRSLKKLGKEKENAVVLGDMNVNREAEVAGICESIDLKNARYAGYSWGVPGNKFYADLAFAGPGLRKDRVLFGGKLCAQAHLVGQCEQFFQGEKFFLSDHFGVMAYVDSSDVYDSRAKQVVVVARVRRQLLAAPVEQSQQKELIEVKALRQAGREGQALARQRVQELRR